MWFQHEGRSLLATFDEDAPRSPTPANGGTTVDWDFGRLPPQRPGRLSSGPAHDLNSMLTAILGFVQLGRMRGNDAAGVQEELDAIDLAARRAVHLVRELAVAEHRLNAEPGPADASEVIADLLPVLKSLINPCEIALELHPDAPLAQIPREAMARVIFNLVLNAREAMPAGGRITISTRQAPGANEPARADGSVDFALSVSDTGIGMNPATLDRIFEPNFTTKLPGSGNGLGLVTVREILQQARGRVTVTSAPGRGTTFLVHIAGTRRGNAPPTYARQEDLR